MVRYKVKATLSKLRGPHNMDQDMRTKLRGQPSHADQRQEDDTSPGEEDALQEDLQHRRD
jgi:hypothetical protein